MKTRLFCLALSLVSMTAHALPNPAAVFCVDELAGEYLVAGSLCKVDNAYVGSWSAMFFKKNGSPEMAIRFFLDHPQIQWPGTQPGGPIGMPNPAAMYCEKLGGTYAPSEGDDLCTFPDDSQIGAWTLLAGPEVHVRLAGLLRD